MSRRDNGEPLNKPQQETNARGGLLLAILRGNTLMKQLTFEKDTQMKKQ